MSASASVLVVCTGNVCRSPFIERCLDARLRCEEWPGLLTGEVIVRSAGTAALIGQEMDARAAERAASVGADPSGFVARQLTGDMVASADLVLAATRDHRARVVTLEPRSLRYCFTVREFAALLDGIELSEPVAGESAGDRVRRLVSAAAGRRGFVVPLSDADADIVDPYRRSDEVYEAMQAQIMQAVSPIVAALAG